MIEGIHVAHSMILSHQLSAYEINEVAVIIVAALAYILALGGMAIAGLIICGWGKVDNISTDWIHGKVNIVCRR